MSLRSRSSLVVAGILLAAPLLLPPAAAAAPAAGVTGPIRVEVDARDAARKVFHARLTFPVRPGPLTLVYPAWIPGEHGPAGPVVDAAGLTFTAGGHAIPWRRDSVNMYAFHLDVPAGADSLVVTLDELTPADTGRFTSGASATENLFVLSWNQVVLSPQGVKSDALSYAASLKLPEGWRFGTALPVEAKAGDTVRFSPVSFTTLVDSPVLAGRYFRSVTLAEKPIPHHLDIAADSEAALAITPEEVTHYTNLVAETGALFGARHYRSYTFLLTLSDHTAHFGLEHHESSDDRTRERSLVDEDARREMAGLLSHEMVHSWNGKYRRPAGLATGDYETPMKGDLLWVYEGLTEYLGQVLAARSGLLTADEYRQSLAMTAAEMDHRKGREWRPLQDTATAAQILYGSRRDGANWRRGTDFYPEGELLWLEADTRIRSLTGGLKSLDDFCRLFHGGESGPPKVIPYTFDDVVAALNQVAPYDWKRFWRERLDAAGGRAPLEGVAAAGWTLGYTDKPSTMEQSYERVRGLADARYSLGFEVRRDGTIPDVIPGSPADRAGVGPGMKLVAVNGRRFSGQVLRDAIRATATPGHPLTLLAENGEFFRTAALDYTGGERYPQLAREASRPDVLGRIIAPRAEKSSAPAGSR